MGYVMSQDSFLSNPSRYFCGVAINLAGISNFSLVQFYASIIQHFGGQVVIQNYKNCYCTHVLHDQSSTTTGISTLQVVKTQRLVNQRRKTYVPDYDKLCQLRYFILSMSSLSLDLETQMRDQQKHERYEAVYQGWRDNSRNEVVLDPICLSLIWVEECFRSRKIVSEEPYLVRMHGDDGEIESYPLDDKNFQEESNHDFTLDEDLMIYFINGLRSEKGV